MSWHFLQGLEAESWEGASLDGAPSALLSLIPKQGEACLTDSATKSCQGFPCGMTCEPSMAGPGPAQWMSFPEGSPAPTFPLLAQELGLMGQRAAFGVTWRGWFAKFDRDSSTWRTPQHSLLGGLEQFSETWPQWGLMLDGECLAQITPMLRTSERGSGFWPTLTASIGAKCGGRHRGKADTLASRLAEVEGLPTSSTGRVNPTWAEWLMGFPEGWTDSAPLGMHKFREWLQWHGDFSVKPIDAPPLAAAITAAEAELSQPARVGLTECNTNDSPWLICKTCAAAGRCAKTAPQKAMTADQIERHIGADEDDREAVAVIVREVEAWHGIERAHNIPAAQEGR